MTEQLEVALLLGGGLSAAGFARVYLTNGSLLNAAAISVSLLAIVFASVLLGTWLPFALARGGVDPAHAGTSIQVGSGCVRVCGQQQQQQHAVVVLCLGGVVSLAWGLLGLDGKVGSVRGSWPAAAAAATAASVCLG